MVSLNNTNSKKPELLIQTGHSSSIRTVVFSPDNRVLATGSTDGVIMLWDVTNSYVLRRFSGHYDNTLCMAFSAQGDTLLSASSRKYSGKSLNRTYEVKSSIRVQIWDVHTGKQFHQLEIQTRDVSCPKFFPDGNEPSGELKFSPNGEFLAFAGQESQLFDVKTGEMIHVLEEEDFSSSIAFSHDGSLLASILTGDQCKISLWDVYTGDKLSTFSEQDTNIQLLAFPPNSKQLLSVQGNVIKLWDTSTGMENSADQVDADYVGAIAFDSSGMKLAIAGDDWQEHLSQITLRDLATGERCEFEDIRGFPSCLAFSADGKRLASGSRGDDHSAQVFDVDTGTKLRTLEGQHASRTSVAFSYDGRILASATGDNIKVWDLVKGAERPELKAQSSVTSIAISPNGKLLASGGWRYEGKVIGEINLWDMASGRMLRPLSGGFESVGQVLFSPDGNILAVVLGDAVQLWDVATGEALHTLDTGTLLGKVWSIAFSPDGKVLASGSSGHEREDSKVMLWDVADGKTIKTFLDLSHYVTAVAFSRDGKALAGAGGYGDQPKYIQLWDVETGQKLRSVGGDSDFYLVLAFSPDGKTLVSGSMDSTINFWDVETGQKRRTLKGHSGHVTSLAFRSDGRTLASGSADATTRLWDASTGEEKMNLIMQQDGNWVIFTPEGLFDSSRSAWDNLLWRFSEDLFDVRPPEIFFDEFFRPNLLEEVVKDKPPVVMVDIAEKDRRQPVLELTPSDGQSTTNLKQFLDRSLKLKIELVEAPSDERNSTGSGVRDVRLFRNGSLVKLWRGDPELTDGRAVLEAKVFIVAGENRFTAYAFNRDNIKSSDATLIVIGDESLKRPATAYILTIGINSYANSDYDLSYAMADAQEFGAELELQQKGLAEFAQVEVIPILNQDATRANILFALNQLAGSTEPLPTGAPAALERIKRTEPEDAVILYFAGHGVAQKSHFYLIPHDLGYHGQRTSVDEAGLQTIIAHSISDLDLEQAFEGIDAGHLVLIIDACNSGQALEAEEKRRGPMNSKGLAQLAYEKGMYVLTAAQGYQAALEAARLGHGYLTYALVEEGLRTAAAITVPGDEQLLLRHWLEYATERVPQMQQEEMHRERGLGLAPLAFVEGEEQIADADDRSVQRPRVFYRRELEPRPFVIARPGDLGRGIID